MEKTFSDNPDEVPTTTIMVEDMPVKVVQATIEDVIERQLVYVRGRRAIITCLDYPLIFWRYINVEKELEIVNKLKTAAEAENPESPASSLTDSLSHDRRFLSASYFCFSLSCDEMMSVLSENEFHRSYSVHPEIFQIDPSDRVERAANTMGTSFSDSEEDEDTEGGGYSYNYSASRFFSGDDDDEGGLDLGSIGLDDDPFTLLAATTELKPTEPEGSNGLRRTHTVVVTPDMVMNGKPKMSRTSTPIAGGRSPTDYADASALSVQNDSDDSDDDVDAAFDAIALPSLCKTSSNPPSVLLSKGEREAMEALQGFVTSPSSLPISPTAFPVSPMAAMNISDTASEPFDVDFDSVADSVAPATASDAAAEPFEVDFDSLATTVAPNAAAEPFEVDFDAVATTVAPIAAAEPFDVDFEAVFDAEPVSAAPASTASASTESATVPAFDVEFEVNFDDVIAPAEPATAVTKDTSAVVPDTAVTTDTPDFEVNFDDVMVPAAEPAAVEPAAFEVDFNAVFATEDAVPETTGTAAPTSQPTATSTATQSQDDAFEVDFGSVFGDDTPAE